ncbi:sensor histidine kinase [Streptohalobacillus salinus]|nr:sensor histidine kinase [Streptohalobacillus salinus]
MDKKIKQAKDKEKKALDSNGLDAIIDDMLETVNHSKDEIFKITEDARDEYENLEKQLRQLRVQIEQIIRENDLLERKEKLARQRLAQVSENFNVHSEDEIRAVYEEAHERQSELQLKREREATLRSQRDDIERRLKNLEQTIERAEQLVSKVSIISNYLMDDFKEVQDLIQNANEKQSFGLRIMEAQEEERLRISREIHDGPAQMMANVLIRADIVDRTYRERSPEEAMTEIKTMRKMVRQSLYEVRRIIYDLRPMALDDLGLVPTIRKYAHTLADYHQVEIHFVEQMDIDRLPEKYEVVMFRLIQEAVQNAIKHANTKEIDVKLHVLKDKVTACVKDNGVGFDLNEKKEQSFGLVGMRERVEMLQGKMTIQSKIGKGTTILFNIPLK